jgi:glycosyltransferase involved in cell wall biosynthesis
MKKTVALCMIVKNESDIILECLSSLYKLIDYWVIADTGSTDNTKEIITKFFKEKNIPGEIVDHEWKNFGHNRTLAFDAAKGKADYALVIDADDYVEGDIKWPEDMDADSYAMRIGRVEFSWWRNQLFRLDRDWEYVGVLHEYAKPKVLENPVIKKLEGAYRIVARTVGARNKNISIIDKYKNDAIELEKALIDEPNNARYQFYLSQSYFDSQQYEKAEESYLKRAGLGGWPEEVYYSVYRIALCKAMLNRPWPEIQQAFLDAYNNRPIRAEGLFHLSQIYRTKFNMPILAFMFAKAAMDIPFPQNEILFVPDAIYNWAILDEVGATAFYAGYPLIGYDACMRLLKEGHLPEEHVKRVQDNLENYKQVIENLMKQNALPADTLSPKSPIKAPKYKRKKRVSA